MRTALRSITLVALITLGACGGGGTKSSTGTTQPQPSTTTTAAVDLPQFASDFNRVCTTQVGFVGASTYEGGPGVHPTVFFEEVDNKNYVTTSRDFPAGWLVKEDTNFKDNSELKPTQLIACSDQVKEMHTGKQCEFENKGEKVKLELVNATWDVTVYEAKTGKQVHKASITTTTTECPMFQTYQKGDTSFVEEPSDDDYINAVKSVVAPS